MATSSAIRLFDSPRLSFLIFASPKSGTTWLQRLLSAHPEAVCAESRAFGDYFDLSPGGRPRLTVETYVDGLSHHYAPSVDGLRRGDTPFYRALLFNMIDAMAETTLRATDKRVYGEKLTPYQGTARQVLDRLHDYNSDVRLVNLVRDGRDVIVSGGVQWLNLRRVAAAPGREAEHDEAIAAHHIRDDDFERFLHHWTDAVSAAREARQRFSHVLDVRYEDVLGAPHAQVTMLCAFLGIDASHDVVARCVEAASFRALSGGRERGTEDAHSFFRKGVAGDWRNWLTPAQRDRFATEAGDLRRAMGYAEG
ncbi:MAG: sulfotransferase domain-containing protein [Acidobacteriota bacterium]